MKILMITRKVDKNEHLAGFVFGWVKKLAENLDKLYVITWQKSNPEGLPENVELISITNNKLLKIGSLKFAVLKKIFKVDGLFCHMNPEYTIIAGPIARLFGKRVVSWYTHRSITIRRRLVELIANKIITASEESFRKPWFKNKVEVLGHGIDINLFKPTDRARGEVLQLLTVGRISPTKDYESMIKAVDILTDQKISNLKLNIIGDVGLAEQKSYFENLKQMTVKMNLEDKVKFLGAVPNTEISAHLQSSDVFINLSGTGSLDKAVLEAMASSCLVLTSNEAFTEILPSELIVEKDNPKQLAEKIKWVMNLLEDKVSQLRYQLREEVVKNHNLDNLVKKIIAKFK